MGRVTKSNKGPIEVGQTEPEGVTFTRSSGNVFADLELENPEELLQKSQLVAVISAVIARRRLTQVKAAAIMGVAQPDLSKLLRGRTTSFSIDRLFSMLISLGVSAHISFEVPVKYGRPGKIFVEDLPSPESKLQPA